MKRTVSTHISDLNTGDVVVTNLTGEPVIVVANIELLDSQLDSYRITWADGRVTHHTDDASFRVLSKEMPYQLWLQRDNGEWFHQTNGDDINEELEYAHAYETMENPHNVRIYYVHNGNKELVYETPKPFNKTEWDKRVMALYRQNKYALRNFLIGARRTHGITTLPEYDPMRWTKDEIINEILALEFPNRIPVA